VILAALASRHGSVAFASRFPIATRFPTTTTTPFIGSTVAYTTLLPFVNGFSGMSDVGFFSFNLCVDGSDSTGDVSSNSGISSLGFLLLKLIFFLL
jgi:hypothetical protein